MTVGDIQLKLIEKGKEYLKANSESNINVYNSGRCFLCSWTLSPGYIILKSWHGKFKNIFKSVKIVIKDVISISTLHNYILINKSKFIDKYDKIIVSWGVKDGFNSDGSYTDRYFKINSKETEGTLWFLICTEDIFPEKVNSNVLVFTKSKTKSKYNFFYLLKNLTLEILRARFSLRKIFHNITQATIFSNLVFIELKNFISNKTKKIIMPYEGQPFQNKIFKETKKINKKIKTIGYVHAFPVGLPTNYIFRDGSPDKLIINGNDQLHCFKKHLNWREDCLNILPSTRYSKNAANMSGRIYLPFSLYSSETIFNSLKKFFEKNKDKYSLNLVVKNHALQKNSKEHLKLKNKINNILLQYKDSQKNNNSNLSIFIGSTSGPIEALERGSEVVHVCDDPVFQSYSSALWPSLKVERLNENAFKYTLSKKGNLILLSESNKIFEEKYIT